MPDNQRSFSIFFPVYNEEKIIDVTILETLRVMESIGCDYEILLINDGSIDGSKEKILKWMRRNNNIRLITHETNAGYGSALRSGFSNAKKDLVFYTDADIPVCLDEIKKVIPFMETYDLVIGYRINREDTLRRFIYSKIYNFLLRILLRVHVKDANFSFKCIKKEVLNKCALKSKSVFIDGELLAEVIRNKYAIKELPIVYMPRQYGKSNFDSLKAAISTMKELISYWVENYLSGKYNNEKRTS